MKRILRPYSFFVLTYTCGQFVLVLVTEEKHFSLQLAKTRILYNFGFGENDVPVIMDANGCLHYYHPKQRVWYKNLKDVLIPKVFPWLVPST